MAKPPAPTGLSYAGKKLWTDIVGQFELRADELRVLRDACREADLVDKLETECKRIPTIVTGSQGQPVINPIIPELRQHRATLAALFRQLKLPDENGADSQEARSTAARAAANARWHKRGA